MKPTLPFVVQEHCEGGVFHWDLMLHRPEESASPDDHVLATWKLSRQPLPENLQSPISAFALPDHRRAYLNYEGTISNNRGSCRIVDQGMYTLLECRSDCWLVEFAGGQLVGRFVLKKTDIGEDWILAKAETID